MDRASIAKTLKNAVVFQNLRSHPLVHALSELLACEEAGGGAMAYSLVCDVARELYPRGECITDLLLELVCRDENFYIDSIARGELLSRSVEAQADTELRAFSQAAGFSSDYFVKLFSLPSAIPSWTAREEDFAARYAEFAKDAAYLGSGIFSSRHVFTVTEDGSLAPVSHPDPQRLSELCGYENERRVVIANTKALLRGLPANNVLLYGDAGTGKSSTVKAIANEFRGEGLRLIQAEKSLLRHIPALLDYLASKPLKFIIFIDDLSFEKNDRDFTALKSILEGSVASRAENTVIYATSNRRHLLRESHEARRGDEVHLGDTLEESASLSDRFGVVVTFVRPDKDGYISLVRHFAEIHDLKLLEDDLISAAEGYAIRSGGRSPRVAKQYVEYRLALE